MPTWESFVRQFGPVVFRTAWRVLGDEHEAEDVTQEVLLELFRSRRQPGPDDAHLGLFRAMAVRRSLDRCRRRRASVGLPEGLLSDPTRAGPEAEAIARELQQRLQAGVARLPPRQAEVFCLRYLHDFSYEDMARTLGISREAVAVALHAARERLRAFLCPLLEEADHDR